MSERVRVLGLFGPSGAGKTTLARLLVERWPERYEQAPTISTRSPRADDGGAYVTVTEAEFARLSREGAFLAETEIRSSAERRLYAYRRGDAENAAARDRIFVAPVEWQLTKCLRAALRPAELLVIGLMPPGEDREARLAALAARMADRYRESPEVLADRLRNAADEDLPIMEIGARSAPDAPAHASNDTVIDTVVITSGAAEDTAALIHEASCRRFPPS